MPRCRLDIQSGQVFGDLTVTQPYVVAGRHSKSLCQCRCGTIKEISNSCLVSGRTKSCGCRNIENIHRNIPDVGEVFGNLTVKVGDAGRYRKRVLSLCTCVCGNDVLARLESLRNSTTTQCRQCSYRQNGERITGTNHPQYTHGMTGSSLYAIWSSMKNRCYNPRQEHYADYGGRGIRIHQPWRESFEAFLGDVGLPPSPAHSLDRIDPDGNYEPDNVRWSTWVEQANNKRRTKRVTLRGVTKPLAEWCRDLGVNYGTAWFRIFREGWTSHDALLMGWNRREWRKNKLAATQNISQGDSQDSRQV